MNRLDKIFKIQYGNQFDLNKMSKKPDSFGINFVSRTFKNNGVSSKIAKVEGVEPFQSGLITVALGGSVLSSFVQQDLFYTGQNIAVLSNEKLEIREKIYYCNVIKLNAYRYQACGREANRTLGSLIIPDLDEIPEWVYDIEIPKVDKFKSTYNNFNSFSLNIDSWKLFKYKDLFEIDRGRGPRKKNLTKDGETLFVSASIENNGVTGVTKQKPCHSSGVITVVRNGNSVASAFYQDRAFCSTEDVHIFTPKFKINKYIALFICTLIRKEKYRFNYGRKWGISRMYESEILLPVDSNGNPDLQFMENYIKGLNYSSQI